MADHTPPTKAADEHLNGRMGQGGDTRQGETGMFHRGRSPDDRSTVPDAAATNHDHPSAPGTITSAPGGGVGSGVGTSAGDTPDATEAVGSPAARQGLANGDINRVEDQEYTSNPRLNAPTDDAGPGPSAGTPQLQDPNYTATERAKKQ